MLPEDQAPVVLRVAAAARHPADQRVRPLPRAQGPAAAARPLLHPPPGTHIHMHLHMQIHTPDEPLSISGGKAVVMVATDPFSFFCYLLSIVLITATHVSDSALKWLDVN